MPLHKITAGQRAGLDQVRELAEISGGTLEFEGQDVPDGIGWVRLHISIDCRGLARAATGLQLKARERFIITMRDDYPFTHPLVASTHDRWLGYPHVEWGNYLCLYAAPGVEWQPNDGMYGFIDRLTLWLERAAAGQLDAPDLPLHPPVAYGMASGRHSLLVTADVAAFAPPVVYDTRLTKTDAPPAPATAVGLCVEAVGDRIDLIGWVTLAEFVSMPEADLTDPAGRPIFGAFAVLTDREDRFHYPNNVSLLLQSLQARGHSRIDFFAGLSRVSIRNLLLDHELGRMDRRRPLLVIVGTPSRTGQLSSGRMQHLVAWELGDSAQEIFDYLRFTGSTDFPTLASAAEEGWNSMPGWLGGSTTWITVHENRPEIVRRRDQGTSATWLSGKRILVLGTGAVGAPIAEHVVRARAASLRIVDSGKVNPGILVRQPYADVDIGLHKVDVLAARLEGLGLGVLVEKSRDDAVGVIMRGEPFGDRYDLIIDATADVSVRTAMEAAWKQDRDAAPPVLCVLVGHDAQRGITTMARPGATGCSLDILRRLAITAANRAEKVLLMSRRTSSRSIRHARCSSPSRAVPSRPS